MRLSSSLIILSLSINRSLSFSPHSRFLRFSSSSSWSSTRRLSMTASSSEEPSSASTTKQEKEYSTFHVYPYGTPVEDLKKQNYRKVKYVHFIRHAQGTHNVKKEYHDPLNIDARLTSKGKQQCQMLANSILNAKQHDNDSSSAALAHLWEESDLLIVTSTLTRCIQTTLLTMEPILSSSSSNKQIPVMAHEDCRETVNYNCDRRRPITEIKAEHSVVDFSLVDHEHDPIWQQYEERLGCTHTGHRESAELHKVADRARQFLKWLSDRPEQRVVVCSHAAFLRCLWNFGQDDLVDLQAVSQDLDDRGPNAKNIPIVQFCGDNDSNNDHAMSLRQDYNNCELRSMVMAFP